MILRIAIVALALSATAALAASPGAPRPANAPAAAQPFRTLASTTVEPWQVAWIGNDEKVNHCALLRGTGASDPLPGEPKFLFVADREWVILRVRAVEYQFTDKKPLSLTLTTAIGERQPLATTGGPDLADIRFGKDRADMAALLASPHLDVRMDGVTVRLPLDGLAAAMPAYNDCMAHIGKPAKGWTDRDVDQLIKAVKSGKARCVEDARQHRTVCDLD